MKLKIKIEDKKYWFPRPKTLFPRGKVIKSQKEYDRKREKGIFQAEFFQEG